MTGRPFGASAEAAQQSGYLMFVLDGRASAGRKTEVWHVRATRGDALLGTIRWFGRWRQYTFFPEAGSTFNPGCLREIAVHAEVLTRRHRAERAAS